MKVVSECCGADLTTKFGTEYPDGPIGIIYSEEVCSNCGQPAEAIEAPPTCEDCINGQYSKERTKFTCKCSGQEMNPAYKAGECRFFGWDEIQISLTIDETAGGFKAEDIKNPPDTKEFFKLGGVMEQIYKLIKEATQKQEAELLNTMTAARTTATEPLTQKNLLEIAEKLMPKLGEGEILNGIGEMIEKGANIKHLALAINPYDIGGEIPAYMNTKYGPIKIIKSTLTPKNQLLIINRELAFIP